MGLKLDGIMTNGNVDSSGETLNVKGHDITDLLEGKGVINWEHEKGPEDIIGAIVYAKKIYSEKDCETDRQRMFYQLSGGPYVYIVGELYEDEQHPGSVACAAMVRYYHKRKEKMFIGWSVEGQTLVRKGAALERSVGRRVAFTLRPCNKSALMGVFDDPKVEAAIKKCEQDSLIKSFQVDSVIIDDPILDIKLSAEQLQKTLVAGNYSSAPSSLVGGAALSVEDRGLRNRVKAAVRDWDRKRPLKETIKAALPEVSDQYVDHFVHVAEDLSLKKGIKPPMRIGPQHSGNPHQSDAQKKLIDGLYLDTTQPFQSKDPVGINRFKLYKLRNDAGQDVMVKEPHLTGEEGRETAHNASAYHSIAHNVFGLGDHVPVTNYFSHPNHPGDEMNGKEWQAQEYLSGAKPAMGKAYEKAVKNGRDDGSLHKLVAMDMILGHPDRHMGNVLVKDGKLMHIDNDDAFEWRGIMPHRFGNENTGDVHDEIMPPDSIAWLQSIHPRILAQHLARAHLEPHKVQSALFALRYMQQNANRQKMGDMHDAISNRAQDFSNQALMPQQEAV